jgi:hypothetical protein
MKKVTAVILMAIIAVSALSVAASASAMPFMNWKNFTDKGPMHSGFGWMFPGAHNRTNLQTSFVRLNGIITQWGSTNVTGALEAQARTIVINSTDVRQGSSATGMWTTNTSRPFNGLRAGENFTYTFYTARLVEPSVSALNVGESDFFMNGTWTVFQVSTNFTITTNANGTVTGFHRDQDAVSLATKAYGELKVTGNWTSFSLAINGLDTLTGSVLAQRITTRMCNPFKVNYDTATTVTNADVASVAKVYGSMPGWGNYDQRMDYNFDYKIDICDLTTAAANVDVQ